MTATPGLLTLQQRLLLEHFLGCRGIPLACGRGVAALYGADWKGGPEDAATAAPIALNNLGGGLARAWSLIEFLRDAAAGLG